MHTTLWTRWVDRQTMFLHFERANISFIYTFLHCQVYKIDDIFITGILAKEANVTHRCTHKFVSLSRWYLFLKNWTWKNNVWRALFLSLVNPLFYGGCKNIGGCTWLNTSLLCTWFLVVTNSLSQWLMSCDQSGCVWLNRSILCTCFRFQAVEWSDRGWASVKCGEVVHQFICYLHHFLCFSLYFVFFYFIRLRYHGVLSAHIPEDLKTRCYTH